MLGPHLTLDFYGCDVNALTSKEVIFKTLDDLPSHIGMHKITAPQIIPYAGKQDSFDKGGISAFVLISESHITIHTWKLQEHASIDIFSCKAFNVEKTIAYLSSVFHPKMIEKNLFMRGEHFVKDVQKVKAVVSRQRNKMG